jgi:hypothetical protein
LASGGQPRFPDCGVAAPPFYSNRVNQSGKAMNTKVKSTRTAALWYASQQWKIFPVWPVEDGACKCNDANCANIGKHPVTYLVPNGHLNATDNQRIINTWWNTFPGWNIGTSSHFRIDVDIKSGGLDNWRELLATHGGYDPTPVCKTPSGGMHIYFNSGDDYGHHNQTGSLPSGIDVRGDGSGYTILPPSNHVMGVYTWVEASHPKTVTLANAPKWLVDLVGKDEGEIEKASFNGDVIMPDIESLQIGGVVKALIAQDRSRIDECVITSLVRAGLSDDEIRAVFIKAPPTTKYAEKNGQQDKYLAHSIGKARAWLESKRGYQPIEDSI